MAANLSMVQLGLVNGLTDARRWIDGRASMDGPTCVNGLNSTLPSRQGALVAWRWANSVDRKRQGGRKGAAFLPLFCRFSAASLPLVKSDGFAAEMRHFCGSFATRQFQLCGNFQLIHGVFAIFRLFDDGIAHVQGHHDSTKGQMVNVQILYESATIERSAQATSSPVTTGLELSMVWFTCLVLSREPRLTPSAKK